jgi:O-antigen/teichoic acid export membrane protein
MFSFSVKLLITSIVNIINQNILTFVFGRLFSIGAVGNYTQANKWNNMANSTISGTIGQIAQTVFVSVSDERDREIRVFRKLLRFTAFLSFPVLFGLALVSHEFILLTIGEKWEDSVPLLQILCIGGAFLPFYTLYQNLTISSGRSDIYMWCNIGQIVIQLALVLLLFSRGIVAIVWAYSALTVLWLAVWQLVGRRLMKIRLLDVLKDVLPFLLISLFVMAVTYFLTLAITNMVLLLVARIVIAVLLYVGLMKLLRAKVMEECIAFVLKKVK